jgi:glycogen debranching enzyme
VYSDSVGDVPEGSIGGLVHADTRFLNRWVLTLNGARLLVLRSGTVDHYSAAFFLTNPELPGLPANTVGVCRLRFVGGGLHERIELQSFAEEPLTLELRLAAGNDFADLFEIKDEVRDRSAEIEREAEDDGLTFRYRTGDFEAETALRASPAPTHIEGDDSRLANRSGAPRQLAMRVVRAAEAGPVGGPAGSP